MRMTWRFLFVVLIALVVLWLFRAAAFRSLIHYTIIRQRPPVPVLALTTAEPDGLDQAIGVALDSTAATLHFSSGNVSHDPAVLVQGGPANCIGYAALCTALLKGQLEAAGLGERYTFEAVVARLYLGGQDLHALFTSPFWKDHDVVRITDRTDNKVILLDPTLYDHVGIGRVSIRSKD
jgi:hypothetical protein